MDEADDVRTSLQTKAQVRPDPPRTFFCAEDVAGASDDAVAILDVLEAGYFTQ